MPLRLCLIGAGHMGRIHARKLASMRDVVLTCIVDADDGQAKETAAEHCTAAARHHREPLREGVRAAVIASTTETHYPVAKDLLSAGVHVFIEKPLAARPEEARELIALAAAAGLVLQVGHLERFSPPFRKARGSIKKPLFIEACRTGPFTGRSTDIDVIQDLMIHDIDLALAIAGGDVTKVEAAGAAVLTDRTDVARARVEFAGGCTAMLTASRVSCSKQRLFAVLDEAGWFSCDLAEGRLLSVKMDGNGAVRRRTWQAVRRDPVHDELRAFIRAVRDGTRPAVDGEDGLRAILLAEAIRGQIEGRSPGGTP